MSTITVEQTDNSTETENGDEPKSSTKKSSLTSSSSSSSTTITITTAVITTNIKNDDNDAQDVQNAQDEDEEDDEDDPSPSSSLNGGPKANARLQKKLKWRKYFVLFIITYNIISTAFIIFRPLKINQLYAVENFLLRIFHALIPEVTGLSGQPETEVGSENTMDGVTFYETFVGPLPFFRVYKRYIALSSVFFGLLLNGLLALVTARLVVRLMAVVGGLMLVNAFVTSVLLMFISGGFAKAYETTTAALVTCLASLWLATSARGVQEGDLTLRRRSGLL